MYDLIIKNATVIDGTGADPFMADVAICDGKIAEVGSVGGAAKQVLDVGGLVLTPGFVDSHSHGDFSLFNPHH